MQLSLRLDADPILPRIRALLLTVYGAQRDAQRLDPTTQFVYAMIGSRTYDAVSWEAFLRLYRFLPSWDALPDTATDTIAAVISEVTHAARKADHLVRAAFGRKCTKPLKPPKTAKFQSHLEMRDPFSVPLMGQNHLMLA